MYFNNDSRLGFMFDCVYHLLLIQLLYQFESDEARSRREYISHDYLISHIVSQKMLLTSASNCFFSLTAFYFLNSHIKFYY